MLRTDAGVDGFISNLRTVNNTPTLSLCSSLSEGERTKVKHNFQRYEASIRDIPNHTFSSAKCELCGVSIMPSWVVEEWNDHESNHFCSSCQVTWGFAISFQNKPCLAPHLILSYCSMCICPHQGNRFTLFHPTSNDVL